MWRLAMALCLLAVAATAGACRATPTQLVVVVDTDLPRGQASGLATVQVRARALAAAPDGGVAHEFRVAAGGGLDGGVELPFSLGVMPGGTGTNGELLLEATGVDDAGHTLAVARAITTYRPGSARLVVLFLTAACGPECLATQTCSAALSRCVDARTEGTPFDPSRPGAELEAGAAMRGDAADVPGDGAPCTGAACNHVVQVAPGVDHSCALLASGEVYCWGNDRFAELGVAPDAPGLTRWDDGHGNTLPNSLIPLHVNGLGGPASAIGAGDEYSCALLRDTGRVRCWGLSDYGQIGGDPGDRCGTDPCSATPVEVPLPGAASRLSVGVRGACAIVGEVVYCWGTPECGNLQSAEPSSDVRPMFTPSNVVGVAVGPGHTCVWTSVSAGGEVWCWGASSQGQLGSMAGTTFTGRCDTPLASVSPLRVPGLPAPALEVATTYPGTCARLQNGEVWCWGENNCGLCGDGQTTVCDGQPHPAAPTRVVNVEHAASITSGHLAMCAVLDDHGVRCWGYSGDAQLGTPVSGDSVPTPVTPALPSGATQVALRGGATCAVLVDGTAACWGRNAAGQVGDGTATTTEPVPHRVVGLPP